MIRNLKALMLAGMALAVFGALAVSSAQAAEFHSHASETTITVKPDGTGKTAHQVFDAPGGGSVTCAGVNGHGVMKGKTLTEIEVTLEFEQPCTAFGQPATVHTAGCAFAFTAHGKVELKSDKGATCKLSVTALNCEISFTTPNAYGGISYHNFDSSGKEVAGTATYITVSAAVTGIIGNETGVGCPKAGPFTTGEFTTGNATIEGDDTATGNMTNIWWA